MGTASQCCGVLTRYRSRFRVHPKTPNLKNKEFIINKMKKNFCYNNKNNACAPSIYFSLSTIALSIHFAGSLMPSISAPPKNSSLCLFMYAAHHNFRPCLRHFPFFWDFKGLCVHKILFSISTSVAIYPFFKRIFFKEKIRPYLIHGRPSNLSCSIFQKKNTYYYFNLYIKVTVVGR